MCVWSSGVLSSRRPSSKSLIDVRLCTVIVCGVNPVMCSLGSCTSMLTVMWCGILGVVRFHCSMALGRICLVKGELFWLRFRKVARTENWSSDSLSVKSCHWGCLARLAVVLLPVQSDVVAVGVVCPVLLGVCVVKLVGVWGARPMWGCARLC